MTPEMAEQVFGLTVNKVMAYAAIANVGLVLVLAAINTFYAWHAKRQADASREQVAASNRQAEVAQKTLDLVLREKALQRQIDLSAVIFQVAASIQTIDLWQNRITVSSYPQLPDVIELRTADFSRSIASAEGIDGIVAGYMKAALLYIAEAETNIRVIRNANHAQPQSWQQPRDRAAYNLNVARFKLDEANTRLGALPEGEQHSTLRKDDSAA